MESPFPFQGILPFFWIAGLMVVGLFIVRTVPALERYLIPACLVGGVLGFLAVNSGLVGTSGQLFETWAYHLFNLSFISLGLTARARQPVGTGNATGMFAGMGWMALTQGAVFGLQAATAGLVVLLFNAVGMDLFPGFGLLLPLGFEEGPGQALSLGKVWEDFGWQGAVNIGLTFAALGFMVSLFIGLPMINWAMKKGLGTALSPGGAGASLDTKSEPVPSSQLGALDGLVFHVSLMGAVYFATYLTVQSLSGVLPPDAGKILWGFTFVIGLAIAVLVRHILAMAGFGNRIAVPVQGRVTSMAVDFLVVSTFCAIQLPIVVKYIVPVAGIALAGTAVTVITVFWLGSRLQDRRLERSAAIFGTVTGTVATGLLLLRVTDPHFRSGVAGELAAMNILSIAVIGPCLLLVNAPLWWGWSLPLTMLSFLGVAMICLSCIWGLNLWLGRRAQRAAGTIIP